MKKLLKSILPPIFVKFAKKLSPYGWKGNFSSWEDAKNKSTGYDHDAIFTKVYNAALKVKNGEAVFERDSVIFDEVQYSWPLLASLMYIYAKENKLNVIDFGGSLGSTYFQNKKFLDNLKNVSWNVIEQEKFVSIGKREFESDILKFFYNINDIEEKNIPNVILLSGVLQYLENPQDILKTLFTLKTKYFVIDRTPFAINNIEKITIQRVPSKIYQASYPCRFFNESNLVQLFTSNGYRFVERFSNGIDNANDAHFFGYLFEKNDV